MQIKYSDRPKTLNGYPVTGATVHKNCVTVLIDKADVPEYVVATWWPELGSTWQWGRYHNSRAAAVRDFADISTRREARDK